MLTIRTPTGYPLRAGRWPFSTAIAADQRDEIWGPLEVLRMKKLVKPKPTDERFAAVDPQLFEDCPNLFGFLCDGQYDQADGGGKRELGSLSMWVSDGLFRAKLNDKDSASCCYVAGASFADLMAAAEAACSDPDGGWKPDQNARQTPKKK